jgi:hypothetical protein
MNRRLASLLAVLALAPCAAAQPDKSVDTYHDAQDRPASSRAASFAGEYRRDVDALRKDVASKKTHVTPYGAQRLEGIKQRADQLDEQAAGLGSLDRGELRRAKRSLRKELDRLRRELDRTPVQ